MNKLKWQSMNMQSQLIWITSLLVVSVVSFITYSIYHQVARTIEDAAKQYVGEALNQLIERHDMILNYYLLVTNSIITNAEVQATLGVWTGDKAHSGLEERQQIERLLSEKGSENAGILAIRLRDAGQREYSYGNTNFACADDVDYASYEEEARMKKGGVVWVKVISNCSYPMLLGMRDIINLSQINQSLGMLYILLDWNRHQELFENTVFLQDGADLFVKNQQGEAAVFTSSEEYDLLQHLPSAGKPGEGGVFELKYAHAIHIVSYRISYASGWTFISLIPKEQLLGGIQHIQRYSLNVGLIGLCIAILCSVLLARKISSPVRKLVKAMTKVERESEDETLSAPAFLPILEMEILKEKFMHMGHRIRTLIQENYVRTINEQEAKLEALQSQINPHFIYNTLDSLYWMLNKKGERQVSGLLLDLSRCLRYAIGHPQNEVPLSVEVSYIEQYVNIQNHRFGGKIKLVVDTDVATAACPIMKLMLQPIVENAILHGLAPLEDGGTVEIRGRETTNRVILEVKDNGVGMAAGQVSELLKNSRTAGGDGVGSGGMGLRNVARRLQLSYGEDFDLRVESEMYVGTVVTIEIPKQIKT